MIPPCGAITRCSIEGAWQDAKPTIDLRWLAKSLSCPRPPQAQPTPAGSQGHQDTKIISHRRKAKLLETLLIIIGMGCPQLTEGCI